MTSTTTSRPTASAVLVLGVISAILLLALVPNTGAIPAASSCPYGNCSTTSSTPTSWYILLGALVVVAALLGVLLLLRRRSSAAPPAPVEPWSGPSAAGPAAAGAAAAPAAPVAGAIAPEYLESETDVGHAPPEVPAAPAAAPAAEGGGDIDSLMQELDNISGEILQRGKPKTPPAEGGGEGEEESGGNGQ